MHVPTSHALATAAKDHLANAHPSSFARLQGRRILVLDDDPLAAVIASLDLEDADAPFMLVHDEASALAALDHAIVAGAPFQAAVLDVNLGMGRTSQPVAERLRAMDVPFVMHTAEPEAVAGDPARWASAFGGDVVVVGKPAPAGALVDALASVLS